MKHQQLKNCWDNRQQKVNQFHGQRKIIIGSNKDGDLAFEGKGVSTLHWVFFNSQLIP